MWDNLAAHHHASVFNHVTTAGHRCVARPPYRPQDGPIEYVFNTIEQELKMRMHLVTDDNSFRTEVMNIISGLSGFDNYFVHCGYA